MKYVLIIVLNFGGADHIEFNSKEACQAVRKELHRSIQFFEQNDRFVNCVRMSDGKVLGKND